MRYHLEIGKRRSEFIISFIIAKDYFSFPAFISVNNKEYKGFQFVLLPCGSFKIDISTRITSVKVIVLKISGQTFAL